MFRGKQLGEACLDVSSQNRMAVGALAMLPRDAPKQSMPHWKYPLVDLSMKAARKKAQ